MIDPIDPVVGEIEVTRFFNLSVDMYRRAVECGALSVLGRTLSQNSGRNLHSLSDLFQFSAALSLGWPIVAYRSLVDEAEGMHDVVASAWERSIAIIHHKSCGCSCRKETAKQFVSTFKFEIGRDLTKYSSVSMRRRMALSHYLNAIASEFSAGYDFVPALLGRVDRRDSQGSPIVVKAGICYGEQLGTRVSEKES
jgi:hypothetical protein